MNLICNILEQQFGLWSFGVWKKFQISLSLVCTGAEDIKHGIIGLEIHNNTKWVLGKYFFCIFCMSKEKQGTQ